MAREKNIALLEKHPPIDSMASPYKVKLKRMPPLFAFRLPASLSPDILVVREASI